jgi:transcriptional regulator with XRE-family HTH domain
MKYRVTAINVDAEENILKAELSLPAAMGLYSTYLSDFERGRQTPTLDLLNRLARAFNVTLAEFFAPLNQPYRIRFRKPRRDRLRRSI